jgi:hypothetical protein
MKDKIKLDDPLLKFYHELLSAEEEKEIISMIFKGYKDDPIIEKLINYSEEKEEGEND